MSDPFNSSNHIPDIDSFLRVDDSHKTTFPRLGNGYDYYSHPLMSSIKGSSAYKKRLDDFSREHLSKLIANNPDADKSNRKLMLKFFSLLIHSLAYVGSRPSRYKYLGIAMGQYVYESSEEPYASLSYYPARNTLDLLLNNDQPYIRTVVKGTYDRSIQGGMRTRIEATPYLLDLLTQANLIFAKHPFGIELKKSDLSQYDHLRISDSSKTKCPLDRMLSTEERVLESMSKRLCDLRIDFALPDYGAYKNTWDFKEDKHRLAHKTGTALHRIFQKDDGVAGRIYGHWLQHAPSSLRQYATFNRLPTIERDFKSLQLMLLYGMSELTPPKGDLYNIKLGVDRFIFKNIFTRTVGNKNRDMALQSIRKSLKDLAPTKMKYVAELYDLFWCYHQPVSDLAFNEDAWKELQTLDSQLMLKILRKLDELEIVAVPIHDSVIVQKRYEADLVHVMQDSICEMFPNLSSDKYRLIG